MTGYLLSHQKEATKYASASEFLSDYLTPEGRQLFNHVIGFQTDYTHQENAETLFEIEKTLANFTRKFVRPEEGLSVITQVLKMSAIKHGAKLYENQEVSIIDEKQDKKFKLITTKYAVTANKLVLAVPVCPMKRIQGSVAEKVKNDSAFDTIGFWTAFKGFAVFKDAWWQHNSTGSRYLADEQEMLSNSDCLGFTFPYK